MDKRTLRKVYLEKRKFLSFSEYERRNRLIYKQMVDLFENRRFRSVHVYVPIKKNKEVDTFSFIQYLLSHESKVKVITSLSDLSSPNMVHVEIFPETTFLENRWGIPEPQEGEEFAIENLDCVIIPMIVGSKTGHRVGYGKGYYDRFLVQCSKETTFVGVSMAPLLDGDLYANEFDVPMNIMITPFQIYNISN